ncbi:MAG: hypothetical protein JWN48_2831 [Myxococcaceae bacterium]|nr:hypothetical protein [Myxococcaceae bacterium]
MSTRSRVQRVCSLGLLACLTWACDTPGTRPPEAAGPASAAPSADAEPVDAARAESKLLLRSDDAGSASAAPLGDPARLAPSMRIAALQGQVESQGRALGEGATLVEATTLTLARGAVITLSLHEFVRLRIVGPAVARLLPEGEPAVLLQQGLVTVDVSPRGIRSTASAFWLATPSLRLDVPDSVRVAVRAFESGATELAVVSGYLTVSQAHEPLAVPSGSSVCVTLEHTKLVALGVPTLELAESRLARAKSCAAGARARAQREALERAYRSASSAVTQVSAREAEELKEHGRLVGTNPEQALALRAGLAHLGAELLHLRARAHALEAQRAAEQLTER